MKFSLRQKHRGKRFPVTDPGFSQELTLTLYIFGIFRKNPSEVKENSVRGAGGGNATSREWGNDL